MNKKKTNKPKVISKTMNFPMPQEEFENLMKTKISEVKDEIVKLDNLDNSNVIHVDFKNKKKLL